MTDQSILKTDKLNFSYPNGVLALKNVSFDIDKGKKIVFLGPNGAGKSTLFLHFNGILRPKSGKVFFDGEPLGYDQKSLANLRSRWLWCSRIPMTRYSPPPSRRTLPSAR